MTDSAIPHRLKALRERAGLSVRAMADLVGMSSSGYSHYETPARFKDAFLPMRIAQDIARALEPRGIDQAQVMALAGSPHAAATAHQVAPGMAEDAASPWSPAPAARAAADRILHDLSPLARNPGAYQLTRDMPGLGLLRGDIIVVDRKALPGPGDLALGNARREDGRMITVIGRFLPPYLYTPESLTTGEVLDVSTGAVALYHPIVASFRAPQMTDA